MLNLSPTNLQKNSWFYWGNGVCQHDSHWCELFWTVFIGSDIHCFFSNNLHWISTYLICNNVAYRLCTNFFWVRSQWKPPLKLYCKCLLFSNETIVYYGVILICIIRFQDIFCTRGTFTSSTSSGPSFVKFERICDIIRPILRSASMELSPIKTVSVKLVIVVQKWRKYLFLFALLTWLSHRWSVLQREPWQHNLPLIFLSKWRW